MPFDALSVATIVIAALALIGAWAGRAARFRIGLILFAALVIRADAANQRSLHPWDERYHALVARHLMDDPLRPTLYRAPALPYDMHDWTANHVWLHKPPGALWVMAASMRVFGANELALRAPSVVLSTLAVLLTFLIGRALFDPRVGLLAAAFHAVNGFLVGLASGRRVADHVDTALIVVVELAIWAVISYRFTRRRRWLVVAGVGLGAGLLVKSMPALVIVPVAFVALLQVDGWRMAVGRSAAIVAIGATVAAPWTVFAHVRYPAEAAWSTRYTLLHITTVVEGQSSSRWTYLNDMHRFYGELILVPVVAAVVAVFRHRRAGSLAILLVWGLVPYVVFSAMATRLPGFVMTAAAAVFLIEAWAWIFFRDLLPGLASRGQRIALRALLVLLALLPGRYLLEPTGAFERRDRWPAQTRSFTSLQARLGLNNAVLFNVPDPIQAMFYSPYTAYSRMPTATEVAGLRARGLPVVIYQPRDHAADVPTDWDVIVFPETPLESTAR